jgi:hypothetical protein
MVTMMLITVAMMMGKLGDGDTVTMLDKIGLSDSTSNRKVGS